MSIESKLNMYIEPFNYNTDFVIKNKVEEGNNSIPQWIFDDELSNRLGDFSVIINSSDIMQIKNIKSLTYDTTIETNIFRMVMYSITSGDVDLYGIFSDDSISIIETITLTELQDTIFDLELNNYSGLERIAFVQPSIGFRLYYTSDINIECWNEGVAVNVEGINVSIDTKLKSYVTLANSIVTSKVGSTQYAYNSELILTDNEFIQLNDFINTARLFKRKIMISIDTSEYVGNRIAGIPDITTTEFTLSGLNTIEKSGLYKYVTITYFSDTNNKVR